MKKKGKKTVEEWEKGQIFMLGEVHCCLADCVM